MTREQVIQGYLMNSPKVVAEMLYDTIERYENRSCDNCKRNTINNGSKEYGCNKLEIKTYVMKLDFCCNKWESKC